MDAFKKRTLPTHVLLLPDPRGPIARVAEVPGAEDVPREWLEGSPFEDYFIPGLVLFVVVGGSLLAAAIFVFVGLHLARLVAIAAGVVVLGWLVVETLIIGYVSWMQPATTIGVLLILLLAWLQPGRT
jgi:hypothetical protein